MFIFLLLFFIYYFLWELGWNQIYILMYWQRGGGGGVGKEENYHYSPQVPKHNNPQNVITVLNATKLIIWQLRYTLFFGGNCSILNVIIIHDCEAQPVFKITVGLIQLFVMLRVKALTCRFLPFQAEKKERIEIVGKQLKYKYNVFLKNSFYCLTFYKRTFFPFLFFKDDT